MKSWPTERACTAPVLDTHHLNPVILKKYRSVRAWYFSVYEGIELKEIYRLETQDLEPYFDKWDGKWSENQRDINNPKIPVKFVRARGQLVYRAR